MEKNSSKLLLDLGDCLRHKLLKHMSEPEAARLTLEDPEILEAKTMDTLKRILQLESEKGFQTKEGLPAFKPKHGSDPQPTEFNICRFILLFSRSVHDYAGGRT